MKKQLLALVLSLAMIFSLLPTNFIVFADENTESDIVTDTEVAEGSTDDENVDGDVQTDDSEESLEDIFVEDGSNEEEIVADPISENFIANEINNDILPISESDILPSSEVVFNDIDSVSWAVDSINRLAQLNVITGDGSGNFAPNRTIKRAEFVQMLVGALKLQSSNAAAGFTDVSDNDWFSSAVLIGQGAGILSGRPDGSFAPNDNISRQDMCVMINNSLKYLGIETQAEAATFSDVDLIADYAKAAVAIVQSFGIVRGFEDNTFKPNDLATRAQTAVMIVNVLNIALLIEEAANEINTNENTPEENVDIENTDVENADVENADVENADAENADVENTDDENADGENADDEDVDSENADDEDVDGENADGENVDDEN